MKTTVTIDQELVGIQDDVEDAIPIRYSIASYGTDYPVDALVKRMKNGDIVVPAFDSGFDATPQLDAFQRGYVWPRPKADRFIESLLLGFPVPGIFLVREDTGRLLVLDGHQRLRTLQYFYEGIIRGVEYSLDGVQERLIGRTYKSLDVEDRRRLDDSIIHATIVRQEEPSDDWSSVYSIFERLNTGGMVLQPQEIRMALYHGEFAVLLRELNNTKAWRKLIGPVSRRLKDVELILRFFSLLFSWKKYKSPMKEFLNEYMAINKNFAQHNKENLANIFDKCTNIILKNIGKDAFRPERAVNAALVDSLMVGVGTVILNNEDITSINFPGVRATLLEDSQFMDAISTGTAQKPKVDYRIGAVLSAIGQKV